MAITTDSMVAVSSGGINYDFYGLSKTLNNYTFDDIWNYVFCSASSNMIYHVAYGGSNMTFYTYQGADNFVPFQLTYAPVNHNDMHYHPDQVMNNPDGLYMKMIWLQRISSGSERFITKNNSYYKLITEFNAPHYVFECTTPEKVNNYYGSTSWAEGSYLYYSRGGSLYYYDDITSETPVRINIPNVIPALIFKDENGKGFIISYDQINTARFVTKYNTINAGGTPITAATLLDWDETQYISFSTVLPLMYEYLDDVTGDLTYPYSDGSYLPESNSIYPKATYGLSTIEHIIYIFACDGTSSYYPLGFEQQGYFRTSQECKRFFSLAGLHFKADKIYKPIIVDGYVTGFTDDLSTTSDLDDWDGKTKHDVPPSPPVPTPPTPDPWDVDAETYGWGGNEVGGMVRYYLLTSTEMDNLVSAMGSSANWVIDYLNNIVSCFIVPNNGLFFDAAISTTVKFRVDNNTEWDTGVSCKRISGVVNVSGGTIEIPRCTNSFLDFEPYSDYSIYIPFCGRVPIKGNIVCGREITVTYYPDVPTCSLTAVVTCGDSTIAIAKGQYGSMIPVTSSGADRKTAAAISDVSSIITGLGVGIAGAATGNAGLLIAGGSNLVGGLLNAAKDSVQSYAYSSGSSGDTSFFAAGTRCQYYANYLQLDDVVNTSEFGHTVGYLCKEIDQLNNFHGFTVCANPHIHISATSTEKEEIKRLLEEGVILP